MEAIVFAAGNSSRANALVKKETIQLIAEHKGNVVIPSFHYKGSAAQ